jgi:hypothetical protein
LRALFSAEVLEKVAAKMYSQVILGEKDVWCLLELGGYLISNYHVVKDATKVCLLTSTGLIDAKVVQVGRGRFW